LIKYLAINYKVDSTFIFVQNAKRIFIVEEWVAEQSSNLFFLRAEKTPPTLVINS